MGDCVSLVDKARLALEKHEATRPTTYDDIPRYTVWAQQHAALRSQLELAEFFPVTIVEARPYTKAPRPRKAHPARLVPAEYVAERLALLEAEIAKQPGCNPRMLTSNKNRCIHLKNTIREFCATHGVTVPDMPDHLGVQAPPVAARCSAMTRDNGRCTVRPLAGSPFCFFHKEAV